MPPHCDALDGPVVKAAQRALDAGDVDLILPYVPERSEGEIREAFELVGVVRSQGPQARELADRYFFEVVVRNHRAGEGAPYTGLKPAGLDVGPVIPAAERAIALGAPEGLLSVLSSELDREVNHRLHRIEQLQRAASLGLPKAREYVSAMLGFQVWAHGVYQAVKAAPHREAHEHAEAA